MRNVAAYMFAVLGVNTSPGADDIKKILSSVCIDAQGDKIRKVIDELNGKKIEEILEACRSKLASVLSCGGAVTASAGCAAAVGGGAAEEKKIEKKEESEEESDDDMGFGLFD